MHGSRCDGAGGTGVTVGEGGAAVGEGGAEEKGEWLCTV